MPYDQPFGPVHPVHTSNSPKQNTIRPEHFVKRLTGRNWKERGICRVTRDGPVYIYVCEATPRYRDRHRTCYAVRVHHDKRVGDWKRFAADFATLEEALKYANCETPSQLAWCSWPATAGQRAYHGHKHSSHGRSHSRFGGILWENKRKEHEAKTRAKPWLARIIKELSEIAALLKQEEEAEERPYLKSKSDV